MAGNRRTELKALFGGALPPTETLAAPETKSMPSGETGSPAGEPAAAGAPVEVKPRSAAGAVKAMGLSLNAISREAEEARALRQALADGERVVGLDPARIEASFVEDRLAVDEAGDTDFEALVESMREAGQQVPVLLRPHPEKDGIYQTAYGHRRIRAAAKLGIEVKAIIRPLSDDELVLAQGKENAERRNLSYIERGLFAKNLASRGFDRKVIGDALAVQKSELSRLMQVAESVPERFIRAIGAAPKVGRERWQKLGAILSREARQHIATDFVYTDRFQAADSDRRFQMLLTRLESVSRPEPVRPQELRDTSGRVFGRLRRDGRVARIEFSEETDPDFLDRAADLLATAHDEFLKARDAKRTDRD